MADQLKKRTIPLLEKCTLCDLPIFPGSPVHRDHAGAVMHADCKDTLDFTREYEDDE